MFIFLLSGLLCFLGVSGIFFCCLGGCVFFFFSFVAVWAGAQAPPKQQKKNTPSPKQQKHEHVKARTRRTFCAFGCQMDLLQASSAEAMQLRVGREGELRQLQCTPVHARHVKARTRRTFCAFGCQMDLLQASSAEAMQLRHNWRPASSSLSTLRADL